MTEWGQKLAGISDVDLQSHVSVTVETKPVWRLVAAFEYRDGLSPAGFEAKYGIPADTVYTWLDRFEERGVATALEDEPRPGRSPRLGEAEWNRFVDDLDTPPAELGYDESAWTTSLVRRHLDAEFGVEYSARHVRRLVERANVSRADARS